MIDTIVLNSPVIMECSAKKIEDLAVIRSGLDKEHGLVLYEFTSKELLGTWESSIRINVLREKFVSEKINDKNITYKVECSPFLRVECSLHKLILGHNIYGGSDNLDKQVKFLVNFLEKTFDTILPDFEDWSVSRLDYAKVYDLGENLDNFFDGFNNVYYPRRRCIKYDNTGLYFPGTYTTLKLYNKYIEFNKHDRKKLKHILQENDILELSKKAEGKLRIEIEVKSRKLKDLYGGNPKIKHLDMEDIKEQYKIELKRIFKVSENNMKIYNNAADVEKRLFEIYGSQGSLYLGTWYRLTINGYDKVKNQMPKSTFYRHINKLKDVGITWNHTDITVKDNKVLHFVFNPFNTNLEVEEDLIIDKLKQAL